MNVLFGISVAFRVLFSIAVYAVCAYSLYKIAKRNGVRYPYLAFIPIVQYYVIGSICEEYVIRGYRIKHLSVVLSLLLLVQTATGIMGIFSAMLINFAASALIALIMHKFYYLFMPQYALTLAIYQPNRRSIDACDYFVLYQGQAYVDVCRGVQLPVWEIKN